MRGEKASIELPTSPSVVVRNTTLIRNWAQRKGWQALSLLCLCDKSSGNDARIVVVISVMMPTRTGRRPDGEAAVNNKSKSLNFRDSEKASKSKRSERVVLPSSCCAP